MSEIAKRNGPCYTLLHIVQALFELELINKTKTIVCWLLGQLEVNPNVSRHQDITLHFYFTSLFLDKKVLCMCTFYNILRMHS